MSDRIKKITVLSLAQILNTLAGILLLPVLARSLEVTEYGTYSQVLSVSTLLTSLFGFGLGQVLVAMFSSTDSALERANYFRSLAGAAVLGGTTSFIIMTVGAPYLANFFNNEILSDVLPVYSIAPVLTMMSGLLASGMVYHGKVRQLAIVSVCHNLIKYGCLFVAIQFTHQFNWIFILLTAADAIALGVYAWLSPRDLWSGNIHWGAFVQIIGKGVALSASTMIGTMMLQIDGMMVSHQLGTEWFAIYRNGAFEVPFFATIYAAIATVTFPEISTMFRKDEFGRIVELKRQLILNTAYVIYPILVFLLINGKDFIVLYLSEKYQLSSAVFWIFNLTLLIRVNDYADILIAGGKTRFILIAYFAVLLINIPMNYFLIEWIGVEGAAIATVVSIFLIAALQQWATNRLLARTVFTWSVFGRLLLVIGLSAVLTLFTGWTCQRIENDWLRMGAMLVLFTSLSYLLFIRLGFVSKAFLQHLIFKRP